MTSQQSEGQDVLIISDLSGNMYLIRRETLEGGRVSDEYMAKIRDLAKSDVSGYMGPGGPIAPSTGKYQVLSSFTIPSSAPSSSQIADALRQL